MIKGRIIKILNQYKVVVDIGADSGIRKDMDFIIYSEGETVKDPDSDEVLGKLENIKARVKVIHIQERLSTLESSETETRRLSTTQAWLDLWSGFSKEETVRKPLPLEVKPKTKGKQEKRVKVRDLVRQDIS